MIDVKNLSKSFGKHLVLDNLTQHIFPGERVVVLGPSGSGKSPFLRCLNLLETPSAGTITFDGVDITDPKCSIDQVREQMGMVFQHFNLFPNMTIRRNITLAPVRTKLMGQEEADEEAVRLLRRRLDIPQQPIGRDVKIVCERDHLIRVRRGVAGLPFGNRLPRYAECDGQLLLR